MLIIKCHQDFDRSGEQKKAAPRGQSCSFCSLRTLIHDDCWKTHLNHSINCFQTAGAFPTRKNRVNSRAQEMKAIDTQWLYFIVEVTATIGLNTVFWYLTKLQHPLKQNSCYPALSRVVPDAPMHVAHTTSAFFKSWEFCGMSADSANCHTGTKIILAKPCNSRHYPVNCSHLAV